MESPGSDLSDYASDDFPEDVKGAPPSFEATPDADARPTKRPRLHLRAPSSPPRAHVPANAHTHGHVHTHNHAPAITMSSAAADDDDGTALSEDTDGSVPASPNHHPGMSQEEDYGQEQVTVCKWEGCQAGDVLNMDNLVEHLHDDHIGTRQKKYSCEWSDCTRKGIPHASGYALRAHMRSHTREKPFYCTLPECDRSFTRSDALAKHMRTVHETEALRPSDPVPKHHSSNPTNKVQRLKLVLNSDAKKQPNDKGSTPASPSSHVHPTTATVPPAPASDADYAHNNVIYLQDLASPHAPKMVQFPPDIDLAPEELSLSAPDLFRLLRRQLHWATQESKQLRAEAAALEKQRKEEWEAKELLLENVMEAQVASELRRRAEAGLPQDFEGFQQVQDDIIPSKQLPYLVKNGKQPWWRDEARRHPHANTQDIKQEVPAPRPAPPMDFRRDETRLHPAAMG